MIGMDCVNQQARERDCKLTKRSQAERLAIADSLIASVWEEYLNGSIDRDNLQVAAYIQANADRIVWKLNELNNSNTPNTLEALDCISRQAAIDAFYKHPNIDWTTLDVLAEIKALPSAQPEIIHCRDCKHRGEKPIADGRYWCEIHDTFMYYCSDAERRTDE